MRFKILRGTFLIIAFCISTLFAEGKVERDLCYLSDPDSGYEMERCKLDLYLPEGNGPFTTLVWFHGGGLKHGSKDKEDEVVAVAQHFSAKGIAFVAVNYRLSPHVSFPKYVDDAAASIQWVFVNAEKYALDKKKVFVGGHSAGGYLAMMSTFENDSTKRCGLETKSIAGVIPISGQTVTHTTVKGETHSPGDVLCDERSPLFHSKKMTQPLLIIAADADLSMRVKENELFYEALDAKTAKQSRLEVFNGRNHVSIMTKMAEQDDAAFKACLAFMASN